MALRPPQKLLVFALVLLFHVAHGFKGQFRTMSGAGNTRDGSGVAGSQLLRIAPAAYEDGISEPRGGGLDGKSTLLGPRHISNAVLTQVDSIPEPTYLSNMFWSFGQFLDHDIDLSHENEEERFDVPVPKDDPKFSGVSKLKFKRSQAVPGTGVSTDKPREQSNVITAFIDGSQVYGSSDDEANNLREDGGNGCLLETSEGNYLKWDPDTPHGPGFLAGDSRAMEQPGLTALHTLFLREHNRIGRKLMKQGLDNETCFQKARLLIGAELQVITVKEFLPSLLGPSFMQHRKPTPRKGRGYGIGIFNEFSTACFRFGHTMVANTLSFMDKSNCEYENVAVKDAFFNPDLFKEHGLDSILRGLFARRAEKLDGKVVDSLRNFLFEGRPGSKFGLDLGALNIQRGRDHGIPNYCETRKALNLAHKGLTYRDVTDNPNLAERLENIYGPDPCEMDLWVAGLSESRKRGGIIGPTCQKVIRKQFRKLLRHDKYSIYNVDWTSYGLRADPSLYSEKLKLSEVTLSKIIRLNTGIEKLPDNVFKVDPVKPYCQVEPDLTDVPGMNV